MHKEQYIQIKICEVFYFTNPQLLLFAKHSRLILLAGNHVCVYDNLKHTVSQVQKIFINIMIYLL